MGCMKIFFFLGLFVIRLSLCYLQKDTFHQFNVSVDLPNTQSSIVHQSSDDDEGLSVEDLSPFSDDENDTENLCYVLNTEFWPETSPGLYTVYYKISPEFSLNRHFQILYGIDLVERGSNIEFRPAPQDAHTFIQFIKDEHDCRSGIGHQAGVRNITLAESCFQVGNIVHELFHALGFVHEHLRPDRERVVNFVASSEDRVPTKYQPEEVILQTEYDPWSVTHYSIENPGPDVMDSFVFIHEKHFLKPFEAGVPRYPSSCDWNGLNRIYRGKKPLPVCKTEARLYSYYHPTQAMLRFPSTRADIFRYCGVYYLDIPGPFLCTLDDYNEYPQLPWLDEAKDIISGLVSTTARLNFCKTMKSSDKKKMRSLDCRRLCFYDCRLTHYSKTLEECMKDYPTCVKT